MPLIRGHHSFDDQFVQIPNAWLRDSRLTLKARGLLAQIMTHREDWSLSINRLAEDNGEGKHAIRAAIAELEKFGYLLREQSNDKRFGESVWVTNDPTEYPLSENPLSEIPLSENQTTKNNTSIEEHLEEEHIKKTNVVEFFEAFWNEYPRKIDRAKALRAFKSALKRAKFEEILAGAIAYRNDPTRKPEFTKYPATWLNADAWENAAVLPEVKAANEERRRREHEATKRYLEEQKALEANMRGPALCKHGLNLARCVPCLKELS